MKKLPLLITFLIAGLLMAFQAQAHKRWMVASTTELSGEKAEWVSVDGSISNQVFDAERTLPLSGLKIVAPDGNVVSAEQMHQGKTKSTFDIEIAQAGTYRVSNRMEMFFVQYRVPGATKPKRARAASLQGVKNKVPANATDVAFMKSDGLIETFITKGNPSTKAFEKRSQSGIELVPITHPNDVYAGETASFKIFLNGQPARNITYSYLPADNRFRNQELETKGQADEQGVITFKPQQSGRYLLEVSAKVPQNSGQIKQVFYAYFATLEVKPQ